MKVRSLVAMATAFVMHSISAQAAPLPTAEFNPVGLPGKSVFDGAGTITPLALDEHNKPSILVLNLAAGTQAEVAQAAQDGNVRVAIVQSGVLYFADGEQVDNSKEKAYPAGSVLVISSGTKHWVSTRESDATVLLTVTKPDSLTPLMKKHIGLAK